VGNMSVIEDIALGGSLECFLVVEEAILERLNLLCKAVVLEGGISFTVGNGSEESVCNSAKELSINVGVRSKSGLSGSGRHRWWEWSCQARDWEQY